MEETEIEMVQRHIQTGAAAIDRQRYLISRMASDGLQLIEAEQLLAIFEDLQRQHEAHLVRLRSRE